MPHRRQWSNAPHGRNVLTDRWHQNMLGSKAAEEIASHMVLDLHLIQIQASTWMHPTHSIRPTIFQCPQIYLTKQSWTSFAKTQILSISLASKCTYNQLVQETKKKKKRKYILNVVGFVLGVEWICVST